MSFDEATRTFSGTPPSNFAGEIRLEVEGFFGSVTVRKDLILNVAAVNDAPLAVAPVAHQTVAEESDWSFQVPTGTFADVDSPTLTHSASLADGSPPPAWLSFDAATRSFAGRPPADFAGTVMLLVTASDGLLSASTLFNLVVTNVNDAPRGLGLTASSVKEFAVDGSEVGRVVVQDPDSSEFSLALLSDAGGRFELVGDRIVVADGSRLDFEQQASHVVRILVSDGQAVYSQNVTIGVANISPEVIVGDERDNTFIGGVGSDSLHGGGGHDILDGGAGLDSLAGGAGNDRYVVQAGDVVSESSGGGVDVVRSSANWTLGTDLERLELTGSANLNGAGNAGSNSLAGNGGSNSLSGHGGNDTLLGGGGHDRLDGGAGLDRLEGGAETTSMSWPPAGTRSSRPPGRERTRSGPGSASPGCPLTWRISS